MKKTIGLVLTNDQGDVEWERSVDAELLFDGPTRTWIARGSLGNLRIRAAHSDLMTAAILLASPQAETDYTPPPAFDPVALV
jgi:hypothetical protein